VLPAQTKCEQAEARAAALDFGGNLIAEMKNQEGAGSEAGVAASADRGQLQEQVCNSFIGAGATL